MSASAAPLARRVGPTAIRTRANLVTIARLVLTIPVLVLILDRGSSWLTFSGWVLLSVTDGLDGWIARRDGTTRSGAFLDPLADKCLVIGGFVALAIYGAFAWVPVVLVVTRELGISLYRSLAGRRGISLPARRLGKGKANVQFLAVALVLFPVTDDVHWLHDAGLWTAVTLSLASGLDIVRRGWREAHGEHVPARSERASHDRIETPVGFDSGAASGASSKRERPRAAPSVPPGGAGYPGAERGLPVGDGYPGPQ